MNKIFLYILVFGLLYGFIKVYIIDRFKYIEYLKDVGISNDIINRMKFNELKATAKYLKQYAKTKIHFAIDHPDYKILSEVRLKYGIFT